MNVTMTRDGVYRSAEPMTEDILRRAAPAIFAESAHESRSDRYCYVPTFNIVEALEKHAGLKVYGATQAGTRTKGKRGHTKHALRFRQADDFNAEGVPEIVLINSHDGGSSYRLLLGCYRFVCANGLIVGEGHEGARIRHQGDVLGDIVEATYSVVRDFEQVRGGIDRFQGIELTPDESHAFRESALALRYDDADKAPSTADSLNRPRRAGDTGGDLWRTMNRVQENLTRGGLSQSRHVVTTDANGRRRHQRRTARAVTGIDGNTKLNQALWTLTERMAELKAA